MYISEERGLTRHLGITGSAIVHHLLKDSSYEQILSFSRRNPGYKNPKIKHATLDLQASADEMAKELTDVSAEHVFFCAYLAGVIRTRPLE